MNFFKILPQLYMSDRISASCLFCLHHQKITHILTVDSEPLTTVSCGTHSHSDRSVNELDVEFQCVHDEVDFNIVGLLDKCVDFIKRSIRRSTGNNILVHW